MRLLWTRIGGLKISTASKNRLFLGLVILLGALAGALVWLILGRLWLPGTEWLLCFAGIPAILWGFMGGMIYLFNHDFRDGLGNFT